VAIFATPTWLLALPLLLLALWWLGRVGSAQARDRRRRLRFAWRAACLTFLLLALAGLRFPSRQARIEVIAAVDVSDSVWNRSAQQTSLRQLAVQLKGSGARLGVVTFAASATVERAPAPLSDAEDAGTDELPQVARVSTPGSETDIGAALDRARGLFAGSAHGRAIVLISDGRDTGGRAEDKASALRGSGIDLLAWPATLSGSEDVLLASFKTPERAQVGRSVPLLVSVSAQREARVRVRVGRRVPQGIEPIGAQDVTLAPVGRTFRAALRFMDRPSQPGVNVYVASLEGPEGQPLAGDYRQNNVLVSAVPVDGPSRWLIAARPGTTLEGWSRDGGNPLGVETKYVRPQELPESPNGYTGYTGVLTGDFSAAELADDAPGLKALDDAVSNGLPLVAVGGVKAFGAGRHPEGGTWEGLLPITFRPEDDRTRTLLFVLDVSATMKGQMAARQDQKLAFACARLSEVTQPGSPALRPTDRIGLITCGDSARRVAPLVTDPERKVFRERLNGLTTERQTNFPAALELAHQTLANDDAEEQVVIFVSDGEPTPMISEEDLDAAVLKLCPGEGNKRRTRLHTFGIATGTADQNVEGEKRLQRMAQSGGGRFFPDFPNLDKELRQLLSPPAEDLYLRREPFAVRLPFPQHPLLVPAGPWPQLNFRNRVRARSAAVTLAQSAPVQEAGGKRKPDPLLVLGHHGLGRTAALALTLDGPAGHRFVASGERWQGGQALLSALLSWVERGEDVARTGWRIETEERNDRLRVVVEARDPKSRAPHNGLQLSAGLSPVFGEAKAVTTHLLPIEPGLYEGEFNLPRREVAQADEMSSVYRVTVRRESATVATHFVSVPYPLEYRHFGTDRTALAELIQRAGGRSRMLDVPDNLQAWLKDVEKQRTYVTLRPALLILAALCLLAEVAARGLRRRTA